MTDRIDDLLLGDDDDEESGKTKDDSAEQRASREFARMRKELKTSGEELETLRAFKVEREKVDREASISGVFQEVGLNPQHAKLFAAVNPDGEATAESVAKFATDYGLVTTEGKPVEAPKKGDRGFMPTVINEGQALGSKTYTHEEFMELLKTDPDKAIQLHQAGRVALNKSPQTIIAGRDR